MKTTCVSCDFCGKTQYEVKHIFQGPRDIAICSECVDLCVKIANEPPPESVASQPQEAPNGQP